MLFKNRQLVNIHAIRKIVLIEGSGDAGEFQLQQLTKVRGEWQELPLTGNLIAGSRMPQYRINRGRVEFTGDLASSDSTSALFTLPESVRPDVARHYSISGVSFQIGTDGICSIAFSDTVPIPLDVISYVL